MPEFLAANISGALNSGARPNIRICTAPNFSSLSPDAATSLSHLMETHCRSCKEVARQLANLLESRRRGRPFRASSPSNADDDQHILALFGTIGEISSRKECISCRDLEQEIARWAKLDKWTPASHLAISIEFEEPPCDPRLGSSPPRLFLAVTARDPSKRGVMYLVNLCPLERGASQDRCGRLIDRHEMNFDLVRGWLQCCEASHGEYCTLSLADRLPPEARPARILLVDLESHCLSYGTLECSYAALSYVWGQTNTLRTTRANLQEHLKPGSLDFTNRNLLLPDTIRDFMRLTARLGICYAWVDSLCVVQDGDDLQQQLNGMAAIFASANLTIISGGLSVNYGLIGTGNGAEPRNRPCYMLRLPDMACVFNDNTIPSNDPRVWEKRAWTFQEGLFSRRTLIFDIFGIVGWKCPKVFWHETEECPSEALDWMARYPTQKVGDWRYFGFSTFNFKWPDMRRWCELVEEYFLRELSFDTDGLNAIAGLITVMESTSPGGFFYGLPELFFDAFLLWDVMENYVAERREGAKLPSWSFLGWKGGQAARLDLFWWRFSMDHTLLDDPWNGFRSDCEIEPIVGWHKESDSLGLVPVTNQFHICRSRWVDEPPLGWTKHDLEKGDQSYYRHESTDDWKFRYPIALPQVGARSSNDKFSQCLHFKAQRGRLDIGNSILASPEDEQEYHIPHPDEHQVSESDSDRSFINASLINDTGRWAGIIRLPRKDVNEFATLPDDVPKKLRLELIAVARGKVRNDAFPKVSDI